MQGDGQCQSKTMRRMGFESRISDAHYTTGSEYERSSKRMLRGLVADSPALHILDVGCGTGLNASFLAKSGHSIVGVDVSEVAVERFCSAGFDGIVCDVASEKLPFPDDSFDLVYASEVIEHCVDTPSFLSQLFRVVKPGGMLMLSTPNSAFWPYRILGVLGQTSSEYQHPGHVRFFSLRSLSRAIESAGFTIADVSARHMYLLLGSGFDAFEPALRLLRFEKERRFATGGHFWQLSRFAARANGFWADTLFVTAAKPLPAR